MKKQVVAVMLSLAMCASTGAEASIVSAAEFSSEVSAAEKRNLMKRPLRTRTMVLQ